jgi:hypothetical protein
VTADDFLFDVLRKRHLFWIPRLPRYASMPDARVRNQVIMGLPATSNDCVKHT